jgi:hypothetical protein
MTSTTSAYGTKRTWRGGLTMSAVEGRTDMPRKRADFRFWTQSGPQSSPLLEARVPRGLFEAASGLGAGGCAIWKRLAHIRAASDSQKSWA